MHTFKGKSCRIHYNSDLSGEVILNLPHDTVTITGNRIEISIAGEVLLDFFGHIDLWQLFKDQKEPGGCLEPKEGSGGEEVSRSAETPAAIIREQIDALRQQWQREYQHDRALELSIAIGDLAEQLHRVEREERGA